MKRIILASFLLPLSACASIPMSPGVITNQTVLDEKLLLGVEQAYSAELIVVKAGVKTGMIRGDRARRIAGVDNRAYRAVIAARMAYRAGNAGGYSAAIVDAQSAINDLIGALK